MSKTKKQNKLSYNKKEKKNHLELIGKVQMTREGFAFVTIEGEENDVFITARKTLGALNGDVVKVLVTREKQDGKRREGRIVEIIERSKKPFIGVLQLVRDKAWVLMQSRTMPFDIEVDKTSDLMDKAGMKVAVIVDYWNKKETNPHGHIIDILGFPGENDTEMHSILTEYSLPYRFEKEVEEVANKISDKILKKDIKNRRDFRKVLTFTIDPVDAKDFDDALSFRILENGNYEVGVHIADVSYYVKPKDLVDKEAQERATSVYLVDRTVPMLPERLSNKLCSLRPAEDKLTFSAVFEISARGEILSNWFGRTIICSDYRFAYETAQQIIDNGEDSLKMNLRGGTDGKQYQKEEDYAIMGAGVTEGCIIPDSCKEAVLILWKIASLLRNNRFKAGAIAFERPEMKVFVDDKGRPIEIKQKISKEANWLIEEFMLLANRSVAEFVATSGKFNAKADKKAKTFVYRIHDEPNIEKIDGLKKFAANFGYKMKESENSRQLAKSLNNLLNTARTKPEFSALEIIALRSMAKAKYSIDNIGHYGLGFSFYTHFTSPIRRYPDIMVHRLLSLYLEGAESQNKAYYEERCKYSSEREIIATHAERDSIKYKIVEYMLDKVGFEYEGQISGLTDWGMYVEIDDTKVEGMVALRDIKSDFFDFDEDRYCVIGKRTKKVYQLGDRVKIKVKAANLEQKLLDYELVEDIEITDKKSSKPKNKKSLETASYKEKSLHKKTINKKSSSKKLSKQESLIKEAYDDKSLRTKSFKDKTTNKKSSKLKKKESKKKS